MTATVVAESEPAARTELLRAALLDDLDSGFALLMREYQQLVHIVVLRVCEHRADADDLTADVFLRAYRALRGFSRERMAALSPRPWLVTIALNLGRNSSRDRGRRPQHVPWEEFVERSPQNDVFDDVASRLDQQQVLAEVVAQLPETQRVAVLLRHLCGLSSLEVADVIGCPEGTVRSHVSRGLVRLRALLSGHPALVPGITTVVLPMPRKGVPDDRG